jgi:2-polyprenyl-6-methoxyphenol hydroxylase-like FAD-dependent oxidoreductase
MTARGEIRTDTVRADLLVVGGGPVGLLAAALAANEGFRVTVLEARARPRETPRALGITPPSLRILHRIGIADVLVAAGVPIRHAQVWGDRRPLGRLSMELLPSPFPFILSVSQVVTESLLRERLAGLGGAVELRFGSRVIGIDEEADGVTATVEDGSRITGSWALGCDGPGGETRRLAAVPPPRLLDRRFAMLDLPETTNLGPEAHLFFSREGSLESFPFGAEAEPKRRRRWIAEIKNDVWEREDEEWIPDSVARAVWRRSGIRLSPEDALWTSRFQPKEAISPRYTLGRLFLCGDAAHEFSPIGGQGMNTGFGDAAAAIYLLRRIRDNGVSLRMARRLYRFGRRPAAKAAARRARVSMWIGTRSGPISAPLRDAFVRWLLKGPLRSRVPRHFAMLTLPGASPWTQAPSPRRAP